MSVMRFTGTNSREAMRQVRAALGEDALILANRRTDQGVEILALADQAAEAMAGDPTPAAPAAATLPRAPAEPAGDASASDADAFQAMSAQLLREMQDMRALLSRTRTEQAPESDSRVRLSRWLREAGFGPAIAEELLGGLPEELRDADEERLEAWLCRQLGARLAVIDDEAALLEQGGILALVGPTGVGKTTTTAKLAARYVMRHGPGEVALVTTDGFRIGAHEQLRIYAGLLDIPMYPLDAEQPLDELLAQLDDKRFVIIDTVGMSQRDQRIIDQVARLRGGPAAVRLVLLLNAASQPETLEEVITNYRQAARAAGVALDDCVISKQDEAGRTGPLLDALMRHGLRLLFVAHGQRVPEDLAVADAGGLVRQALATRSAAPPPEPRVAPGHGLGLLGQGRRVASVLAGLRERITGFAALESAWALAELPPSVQGERLDALHEQRRGDGAGLLWTPRSRVRGGDWSPPDLLLDAAGGWSALPLLQHRQPAGLATRLDWAGRVHGARLHLLPALPDGEARAWLATRDLAWVAQARAPQRVTHEGERRALGRLADLAAPLAEPTRRLKGREVRVGLSRLSLTDEATPLPLRAWFAELEEAESGRRLGRRCWLAPERLGDEAVTLLLGQLDAEALPRLTRRAFERLAAAHPAMVPELRLTIAAGLAAVAGQLERSEAEWAMDLRAALLGLLGGRRRRSAETLLEALLHLGVARDAIRQLGAAGLEGLG
ncbi:flagellar biosynthesis protein FlhF [Halomonas sp. C05BenzN]|uniref:flagellar biosynthesis protein FlhF n=1 Tax=Halomonas sp. C05BenzN TaxID=3411041 RepID=UPI003B941F9A